MDLVAQCHTKGTFNLMFKLAEALVNTASVFLIYFLQQQTQVNYSKICFKKKAYIFKGFGSETEITGYVPVPNPAKILTSQKCATETQFRAELQSVCLPQSCGGGGSF